MDLAQAIKELENHKSVRRKAWDQSHVIKLAVYSPTENRIKSYFRSHNSFTIHPSMFAHEEWIDTSDTENNLSFYKMITALKAGKKITLPHWNGAYIFLDRNGKDILYSYLEEIERTFTLEDCIAQDWEVVESI